MMEQISQIMDALLDHDLIVSITSKRRRGKITSKAEIIMKVAIATLRKSLVSGKVEDGR